MYHNIYCIRLDETGDGKCRSEGQAGGNSGRVQRERGSNGPVFVKKRGNVSRRRLINILMTLAPVVGLVYRKDLTTEDGSTATGIPIVFTLNML